MDELSAGGGRGVVDPVAVPSKPMTVNPLTVTSVTGSVTTGGRSGSGKSSTPMAQIPSVLGSPKEHGFGAGSGSAGSTSVAPCPISGMPSVVIVTFSA